MWSCDFISLLHVPQRTQLTLHKCWISLLVSPRQATRVLFNLLCCLFTTLVKCVLLPFPDEISHIWVWVTITYAKAFFQVFITSKLEYSKFFFAGLSVSTTFQDSVALATALNMIFTFAVIMVCWCCELCFIHGIGWQVLLMSMVTNTLDNEDVIINQKSSSEFILVTICIQTIYYLVGLRVLWKAEMDSVPDPQSGIMVMTRGGIRVLLLEMHSKVKGVTYTIACTFKLLKYNEPGLDGPDTEIQKNFA